MRIAAASVPGNLPPLERVSDLTEGLRVGGNVLDVGGVVNVANVMPLRSSRRLAVDQDGAFPATRAEARNPRANELPEHELSLLVVLAAYRPPVQRPQFVPAGSLLK